MTASKTTFNVVTEFAGVRLGDARLERRAELIVQRLAARPAASFPSALATAADLEGFYRFIANPNVSFDELLQPHVDATLQRMAGAREALVVHDTTEFLFGGTRQGLAPVKRKRQGFPAHFSFAVPLDEDAVPFGVLGVHPWVRSALSNTKQIREGTLKYKDALKRPNEQERWFAAILATESIGREVAGLIHVMDSEADDFDLFSDLVHGECRFVVRLSRDRLLATPGPRNLSELIATRPVVLQHEVSVSPRRRGIGLPRKRSQPRAHRNATLAIRAGVVTLRRPTYLQGRPESLTLNFVSVKEQDPPAALEPIDWLLLTTEPVDTEEAILKVIDAYRARWRIEELFKALKTGCAFEKRQLESGRALLNALALLIPIAWSLLRLRAVSRATPDAAALTVVTAEQLDVLRRAVKTPFPTEPNAEHVLAAVAELGGHHRSNGPPGWELLGRGYQDLLMLVAGYRLGRAAQK